MRIIFLADIHEDFSKSILFAKAIKNADLTIIGGDIAYGSFTLQNILMDYANISNRVLYIRGNHDPYSQSEMASDYKSLEVPFECDNVTDIELKRVEIGGLSIGGLHYPHLFWDEPTILEFLKAFGHLDILVSHSPPLDVVDTNIANYHCGSIALRMYINEFKPKLVLCGHIHEAFGIDRLGPTVVVNAGAVVDGRYAVIDIDKNELNVRLESI